MFIYVTTTELRDKLLSLGYTLFSTTDRFFIFENKASSTFDLANEDGFIISNTLAI